MSDAESLMWRLEKDPYLSSTVANVTVLDTAVDFDRFRRRLERASRIVPRLRQRVQPTPVSLTPPLWVDDPEFDLDYHVRHVALPEPGTLRQLCDLATLIAADPFDRTRPLWAFFVVDGLEGGQGAIIQKLHHTVADGEGSLRLSMQFIDLTRDAEDPPMPPVPEPGEAEPAPPPSAAETVRDVVAGSLRMPIGISRQYRGPARRPDPDPDAPGATLARTVKGVISQLSDVEAAHSPVWTQRSLKRRLETLRSPLGRDQGGGQEAGRHAEHRVHLRRRGGRGRLPPRRSAHRSSSCGRPWPSAPGPRSPARTRSRSPGCWCRPARWTWPSGSG